MSPIDTMILSVDQITQEVTTIIQLQQQKHNLYSGGTNINNKICLIEEPFLYRIHYYTHCSTPLDHSCTVPQSRLTGNSNVGNRSQEQQRSTWGKRACAVDEAHHLFSGRTRFIPHSMLQLPIDL